MLAPRAVLLCALALTVVPGSAFAQDDDLLAPLTPSPGKRKVKKPKSKAPRVRSAPPAAPARDPDADLVAPLVPTKTEVWVKLGPGVKGGTLLIDGQERGSLPLPPQSVPAGAHTIEVRRPGYAEFVQKVQVPEGQTFELVANLEATAGVVTVQADQPGAQVLIDGEDKGEAPLKDVLVEPGAHEI